MIQVLGKYMIITTWTLRVCPLMRVLLEYSGIATWLALFASCQRQPSSAQEERELRYLSFS